MKSRYLINSVLILVILGLYWFLNQSPQTSPQQTISIASPADITDITITRSGLDTVTLQKIAAKWQLKQPLQAPANHTRVKLLLSILDATSHSQLSHPDDTMLQQLGFTNTSTSLQLNDAYFQFGDIETISKRRYILHNGNIHLIDDTITPLLKASIASFIANKLIPVDKKIAKLILPMIDKNAPLSIEQQNGQWTSNDNNRTSQQLSLIIEAWQQAYALQVLPLSTAKLPATESHKITIWYKDEAVPTELKLQFDETTLYLNNASQQLSYQFPNTLMQQLLPTSP